MRIKVVKAFAGFSVGAIVPDMPGGQARTLIARGLVEEIKAPTAKAMQAPNNRAIQAPAERAVANQSKPTLKLK
jgi:hypothetical protein